MISVDALQEVAMARKLDERRQRRSNLDREDERSTEDAIERGKEAGKMSETMCLN
jgi:hypothetical protein